MEQQEKFITTPELRIKPADDLITEFHGEKFGLFGREDVLILIQSAQNQAIKATIEVCECHNADACEVGDMPNFKDLINSPELKVK
jgi:hypothetical protein